MVVVGLGTLIKDLAAGMLPLPIRSSCHTTPLTTGSAFDKVIENWMRRMANRMLAIHVALNSLFFMALSTT